MGLKKKRNHHILIFGIHTFVLFLSILVLQPKLFTWTSYMWKVEVRLMRLKTWFEDRTRLLWREEFWSIEATGADKLTAFEEVWKVSGAMTKCYVHIITTECKIHHFN